MGDRSSWLSKEATVNGLFAAHVPGRRRRKSNKVLPQSHAASEDAGVRQRDELEGELTALRNVVSQESRMKDKLMDTLSSRCSLAEAKVEELERHHVRAEKELAATRLALHEQAQAESSLGKAQDQAASALAQLAEERRRAQKKDAEVIALQRALGEAQVGVAEEREVLQERIAMMQGMLVHERAELDKARERHEEDLAAAQRDTHLREDAKREQETSTTEELEEHIRALERERGDWREQLKALTLETEAQRGAAAQSEAAGEVSRRRAEGLQERLKARDAAAKDAQAACAEAEAKARRLADQLKASSKKAQFLEKKADAMQAKFIDKEKLALQLGEKVDAVTKKYREVKERLEYIRYSSGTGQGAPGCAAPLASGGNNNNHDDDDDDTRGRGLSPLKSRGSMSLRPGAAKRANALPAASSTAGRQEDHQQRQAQRQRMPAPLPDGPAQMASPAARRTDSNNEGAAPLWMQF